METPLSLSCEGDCPQAINAPACHATLRIFGDLPDLGEISANLGLRPTYTHQKGDPFENGSFFSHDMWSYTAPLDRDSALYKHIDALWMLLKPHKHYLLKLKNKATVDVFLGWESDRERAGVQLPYGSLEMFQELKIPFELAIAVTWS